MSRLARTTFFVLSALCLTWRAWAADAPVPAMAVIVHAGVTDPAPSQAELAALFTMTVTRWHDGTPARPLNLPAGSALRVEFDRVVLRMTPDETGRFWIDKRVRGEGTPPRQVPSPDLLARLVAALPGAFGYVPEDKVVPGVRIIARVRDGKLVRP